MSALDEIRQNLTEIREKNPFIHLDISMPRQKLYRKNIPAEITGIYKHVFQIEEHTEGKPQRHTLPYTDIIVRHIVIAELENKP